MRMHPQFKLNGQSYDRAGLLRRATFLSKNGKPFEKAIGDFLQDWLNDSKTIAVTTSGSTGKPKKIYLLKEHMVNSALSTGKFFNLHPGNRALLCLSAAFIAGKMMLVRAMVLGMDLDVVPPSGSPLAHNGKTYDFCAMVPLQAGNSRSQLNQIRTLILGGAPVSYKLAQELKLLDTAVYETFGMTETISHIAVKQITKVGQKEASSMFATLPDVHITLDSRGCLVIEAPKISAEKLVTNDLAMLIGTTHFKWLGRFDNIINSGGIKVIPEQIEEKLAKHITVRFFVAGVPDVDLGHKVVLFTEGHQDEQKLLEQLKSDATLHKFEIPKAVVTVRSFQETKNGKVNRIAILKSLGKV
ncbi:MAG: AMP-binding protein [Bacteroidota bacterium]